MKVIALRIVGGEAPGAALRQVANHHLQSLIDLRPTWRLAVLARQRGDEHDLPFRTRKARLFPQGDKIGDLLRRLIDTHERGEDSPLAGRMSRPLRWGRVVWRLGCCEQEEEAMGLLLRNRGSQKLVEMRTLAHGAHHAAFFRSRLAENQTTQRTSVGKELREEIFS